MIKTLATAVLALSVITSCDYKDLCYHHWDHALGYDVEVTANYEQEWEYPYANGTDWQANWPPRFSFGYDSLRPGIPEGLRAVVYFHEDNTNRIYNLPPYGGTLHLAAGKHDIIFHNNDTEYIVFDDMNSYASARATTRTRTRGSYQGSPFTKTKAETTVNSPDMLYGNYTEKYEVKKSQEPTPYSLTMKPLVFSYYVRFEFEHGLEYVALARGAMAGMAAEVYLNSGRTSPEPATVLFDCSLQPFGTDAIVKSFGVPNFPNESYTKSDEGYGLNLELRLRNGKMISQDFNITDQISAQPHGGVIVIKGVRVEDEDGKEDSSGFLVDVSDWGEFNDIYLPL